MRKLPEGCWPNGFWWKSENAVYAGAGAAGKKETACVEVEIHPLGTRALLEEALKMVERIDTAWTRDFSQGPDGDYTYMRLSDETRETWNGIRALLAKARGEGT